MLFENNRDALRKKYLDTWHKHVNHLPLEPLESQILDVMLMHPEYHRIVESKEISHQDYLAESGQTNPYLHMGLHLGLREQLQTDRPSGIRTIHQNLCMKLGDPHQAEHLMMECLAQVLWEAQRNRSTPDERVYLEYLKNLQ